MTKKLRSAFARAFAIIRNNELVKALARMLLVTCAVIAILAIAAITLTGWMYILLLILRV